MELQPTKPSQANFSVDLVRTVAIVMVVLVHASGFPYQIPGEINSAVMVNWFTSDIYGAIGYLGVPLFVMLNGSLLLIPAKSDEPMRVFFKKRFNRVGVPLIFWTAVYFIWNFGVHEIPFTPFNFQQGLLSGSYPILWFLYMLIGLYLVTPILRPLVIHLERKKFTFLMIIWFVGTISVPLIHTFTAFSYNPLTFVFTDWVGYYLLGIYLQNTKVRSSIIYLAASLGLLVAVLGSWFITTLYGEQYTGFFHGYLSFNMIIASAALFLILIGIPRTKVETGNGTFNRLLHWIGQNTLPIYLVHIIVLESLHLGLLGFFLPYTHDLLIDVPVVAFVTFVLSSTIIYVLKKIPHVSKLMG